MEYMMSDLILQLEDKRVLLLRVFTAVYGSLAPASGLKQVTPSDLCTCRTCCFYTLCFRRQKGSVCLLSCNCIAAVDSLLVLLGSRTISEPIRTAVWLLVQLQSRVKYVCEGAKDAS